MPTTVREVERRVYQSHQTCKQISYWRWRKFWACSTYLATIAEQNFPLEFAASMIAFDGTYSVVAERVGKQTLSFDGIEIEASLIDVKWLHHESGDVYPPGPGANGGRYWLVAKPPAGFPYVPRYQTDTYAVEFIRSVCPGDD